MVFRRLPWSHVMRIVAEWICVAFKWNYLDLDHAFVKVFRAIQFATPSDHEIMTVTDAKCIEMVSKDD